MCKTDSNVRLPEGVSLQQVAQVLVDAWEVGSHQWTDAPSHLRESGAAPLPPVPADALEFFRLLGERRIPYLLVGGIAMLTYVQGRNTKDVGLVISLEALRQVPELRITEQNEWFAHGQ